MKSLVKWLIAGGVILCIGIIIMLCGLAANGWKWGTVEDFEQKEYVAQGTVNSYDISIAAGTVKVEFTDDEVVSVSYPESEHFGYKITEENCKLTLAYDKRVNYFFGWFMPLNIPDTVIKVPHSSVSDFDIDINAGKLVLPQGNYGKINVDLNAGKFEGATIYCNEFDFQVNAGSAAVTSVECPTIDVDVNAGSITLGKAVCEKLTVTVSAGSANVSGVECPDIAVDVSAGSANLAVDGVKSEYNISVDKSAGSCNLYSQAGSDSSKHVRIDVSAGSATVNFSD